MRVLAQKIKITFLVILLTNLFVSMVDLVNQLFFTVVKMLLINLLKQFLKSMNTVKEIMKKHFNKNLIMSEKEEQFQSSNACWICEKRIDNDDENVRDHCHVTGTFRGAAH